MDPVASMLFGQYSAPYQGKGKQPNPRPNQGLSAGGLDSSTMGGGGGGWNLFNPNMAPHMAAAEGMDPYSQENPPASPPAPTNVYTPMTAANELRPNPELVDLSSFFGGAGNWDLGQLFEPTPQEPPPPAPPPPAPPVEPPPTGGPQPKEPPPPGPKPPKENPLLANVDPTILQAYRDYEERKGGRGSGANPFYLMTLGQMYPAVANQMKGIFGTDTFSAQNPMNSWSPPKGVDPLSKEAAKMFLQYLKESTLGGFGPLNNVGPGSPWNAFNPGGFGWTGAGKFPGGGGGV